jgi:phage tail-like protein
MAVVEASSRPSPRGAPGMPVQPVGRGSVEGLPCARPLGEELPALLQEDDFCQRFTQGLDDVLAPVYATLDCFDTYLDNALTPDDFVDWLASWVGVDIDENWPVAKRRALIDQAVALYRVRGTATGLAAHVGLYTGVTPEIADSGGCEWSQTADTALPGTIDASLTVRVLVDDPASVNMSTLERIVVASRPAHVVHRVEIVTSAGKAVEPPAEAEAAGEPEPAGESDVPETDDAAPGPVDLPGSEKVELAAPGPDEWDEDDEGESSEGKEPSA